jgi:hypothetical protein
LNGKVKGGRGTLHKKNLQNLYFSTNIIVIAFCRIIYAGHVSHMGQMRNACEISVGISEEKRPIG